MSEPEIDAKGKAAVDVYHVVGPGSLRRNKQLLEPGATLELTASEALELGNLVAKGRTPKLKPDALKRVAGKYRVKGPGTIWFNGEERQVGYVAELNQSDARTLGDAIKEL